MPKQQIQPPYYPIVYVRGYAMTAGEREQVFHDAYYGFGITSVEKRQAPPPRYFEADIFEGLLIRLMKDHDYIDSTNAGLGRENINPSRSIWVSRFYDPDFFSDSIRGIVDHAEDLYNLICTDIPKRLKENGVDLNGYKVILVAHSMGGLVCRALIQNLLPKNKMDPKDLIHRFVTMGTPHRGIDLGAIPDILEDRVVTSLNPFDASIFKEPRMREYLNLGATEKPKGQGKGGKANQTYRYDVHSLGAEDLFPIKRCLCIIGSDWSSYGLVRKLTGGFSDGLVKQDRAYLVSGPQPSAAASGENGDYDEQHRAYWVNVHRAHSGYRGIVNSYESYENIQRFLFGDIIFRITLEDIELRTKRDEEYTYFYDFEFLLSIRGTSSYLHRRQQDPCENAIRVKVDGDSKPPKTLNLHTGFMSKKLRAKDSSHSYFQGRFQVAERRVKPGWLWDRDYPTSVIYNETLEARVGDEGVEYRWLSDLVDRSEGAWQRAEPSDGGFRIPMREAKSFAAKLVVRAGSWPDQTLTKD
jgi:pimeloyl-ACP methyl ester carboxylesterase